MKAVACVQSMSSQSREAASQLFFSDTMCAVTLLGISPSLLTLSKAGIIFKPKWCYITTLMLNRKEVWYNNRTCQAQKAAAGSRHLHVSCKRSSAGPTVRGLLQFLFHLSPCIIIKLWYNIPWKHHSWWQIVARYCFLHYSFKSLSSTKLHGYISSTFISSVSLVSTAVFGGDRGCFYFMMSTRDGWHTRRWRSQPLLLNAFNVAGCCLRWLCSVVVMFDRVRCTCNCKRWLATEVIPYSAYCHMLLTTTVFITADIRIIAGSTHSGVWSKSQVFMQHGTHHSQPAYEENMMDAFYFYEKTPGKQEHEPAHTCNFATTSGSGTSDPAARKSVIKPTQPIW